MAAAPDPPAPEVPAAEAPAAEASAAASIGDLLRATARRVPAATAFVDDDGEITWAALDRRVSAAARAFVAAGLVPGDRVALLRPSSIGFVVDHLGALRAGLVCCPVNPELTPGERAHVLGDSGARAAATGGRPVEGLPADVAVVVTPEADDGDDGDDADPALDRTGDDVVVLLYTSGTSGRPRGAMLSSRALLANVGQVAAISPPLVGPDDVVALPVPLFHVFGLGAGLGAALRHGTTTLLTARFDPRTSAERLRRHGATVVVGAPPMYAAWARLGPLEDTFAGVRLAVAGAAALPAALARAYLAAGVALYEGYGLTETAPVLTSNAVGATPGVRPDPTPGSIGRPLPGVEARLLDAAGGPVDAGDPGQLWVRGPNLFSGYWPDGRDAPGERGFATGDIAVGDDDGNLRLVGRTTDLVVVNGFNVYPAEVESVLGQVPGVAEVAVVGEPDPRTGEAVVAYVVAAPGTAGDGTGPDHAQGAPSGAPRALDADVLRAAAARSLARYKVPARFELVGALPHTATGKVQKWRLVGAAAADDPPAPAGPGR